MPLIHYSWKNFLYITEGEERLLEDELASLKDRPNPFGLTQHDMLSIWIYTSTDKKWYETINARLRKNPGYKYIIFKDLLNSALRKMPIYKGVVYRGINIEKKFKAFLETYRRGGTVRWDSFTSTAKTEEKSLLR